MDTAQNVMPNCGYRLSRFQDRYFQARPQISREERPTSSAPNGDRAGARRGGREKWNTAEHSELKDSGGGSLDRAVIYCVCSVLALLLIFVSLFASSSHAADGGIWIDSGMVTRHNDRSKGYRENNTGTGIEYQFSDSYTLHAGQYWNSLRRSSEYFGVAWQPQGQEMLGGRPGILLVAVTGYGHNGNQTPIIAPVPVITWEYHMVGINVYVIPGVLVSAQLKLKVW